MLAKTTLDRQRLQLMEKTAVERWGKDWRKDARHLRMFEALASYEPPAESAAEKATPATFKWWHVLLTAPNREAAAAEWLQERAGALVYLPHFVKQVCWRGRKHQARLCAVIPGMLFAPVQIMEIERRDETFEFAGVRDFIRSAGQPARVSESDIDLIRVIEAKLNLPPEAKGVLFKIGEQIRFKDQMLDVFWGSAVIFEIANEARIGVEVRKLFGRPGKVYVPASEIEAM